jgi:hypothetical protein
MAHPKEFSRSSALENEEDEAAIMADKDQTRDPLSFEHEERHNRFANNVEDEPEDFIEGDVDVKRQMDRTERLMQSQLDGTDGNRGRHEDDRAPNP